MIDLIATGINHGIRNGREIVEIASICFIRKCQEWIANNTDKPHCPL